MKVVLIILVLAAGGGGWWYFTRGTPQGDQAAIDAPLAMGGSVPLLQPPPPAIPPAAKALLDQADAAWQTAGEDPARSAKAPAMSRLYSKALRLLYNQPGCRDQEQELVARRLKQLGDALFFSKQTYPDDPLFGTHLVGKGDSPEAIARRYGMSSELFNRLRGREVNDSIVRLGESAKILRLKEQKAPEEQGFHLHVDKGEYSLDLFIGGLFARRYLISHGAKESPTPTGRTHVAVREWHPAWTNPKTKQPLAYGDPENILGPIWLGFDAKELGASSIGIHGYTGPNPQLGAQVSNGCIRLANDQAEELFQTLSPKDRAPTTVEIVD